MKKKKTSQDDYQWATLELIFLGLISFVEAPFNSSYFASMYFSITTPLFLSLRLSLSLSGVICTKSIFLHFYHLRSVGS